MQESACSASFMLAAMLKVPSACSAMMISLAGISFAELAFGRYRFASLHVCRDFNRGTLLAQKRRKRHHAPDWPRPRRVYKDDVDYSVLRPSGASQTAWKRAHGSYRVEGASSPTSNPVAYFNIPFNCSTAVFAASWLSNRISTYSLGSSGCQIRTAGRSALTRARIVMPNLQTETPQGRQTKRGFADPGSPAH